MHRMTSPVCDLPEATITVSVDLTNPGQFFACCGLFELAHRMQPGALAWFEDNHFCITDAPSVGSVVEAILACELHQLDPDDDMSSPMRLGDPFGLVLDWWGTMPHANKALKVWAGSMRSVRIAHAMKQAVAKAVDFENLFEHAAVVYDPNNPNKKVEPFYFDSRRGWNAQSLDIGFAPDGLSMTTAAYPAVEFLCLVGLQRCRPAGTKQRRVFDYTTWSVPLSLVAAGACCQGLVPQAAQARFRFENGFRTNQKKHKSFLPATFLGDL